MFLVALPLLIIMVVVILTRVSPLFRSLQEKTDALNLVVQENLTGIRVVKSFVREDREIEKFTTISGDIYRDFCRAEHILALNNPIMMFCVYACSLAISWFGAQMVVSVP